ncbi:hypothetical protein HBH88_143740 [Parastagonospora nodorum]|nr:hypothetical protein HBI06_079680 [Parastagonospora nodorum]KAH4379375.1 hypothetical protein HBH94_082080 [Parastagonospora nodorum]KAH4485336.1 hypothetical protein HBH88_143740 [Parastagonospora nodorum]KAH4525275.1 hypothetical protein HBH87_059110 [Parastagonospora nodorum]KAH4580363.1 hypothetical protein HBH84_052720 [Parastagonospora nodorum]
MFGHTHIVIELSSKLFQKIEHRSVLSVYCHCECALYSIIPILIVLPQQPHDRPRPTHSCELDCIVRFCTSIKQELDDICMPVSGG